MAAKKSKTAVRPSTEASVQELPEFALESLHRMATPKDMANLARFGIVATKPIGVAVSNIHVIAKQIGRSHELAAALWATGVYEARMLAAFVDESDRVTPAQMDRWCRDFDNWAICDTVCFHLFDRTPYAFAKIEAWSGKREEFVKRGAFALLASVAGHDKTAGDALFLKGLRLVEREAEDDRNFVKKGINWALRRIATRNSVLKKEAMTVAKRLAESSNAAARWVGKDTLREFQRNAARAKKA